jgi:addiction module HigA family antidote
MRREVPLIHPGVILLRDWLEPLGISKYALAKAIDVPRRRINDIVQGHRAITVDTAGTAGRLLLRRCGGLVGHPSVL